MDGSQPPITHKSNSFSSSAGTAHGDKLRHRNLSLNAIHFEDGLAKKDRDDKPDRIDGGGGGEEDDDEDEGTNAGGSKDQEAAAAAAVPDEDVLTDYSLATLIDDIDQFLTILLSLGEGGEKEDNSEESTFDLPEIPQSTTEKFVVFVEQEVAKYESGEEKLSSEHLDEVPSILDAINRMSKLTDSLSRFAGNPTYLESMNIASSVLQHAMSFLEDEFHSLLEESSKLSKDQVSTATKTKRPPSFSRSYHD